MLRKLKILIVDNNKQDSLKLSEIIQASLPNIEIIYADEINIALDLMSEQEIKAVFFDTSICLLGGGTMGDVLKTAKDFRKVIPHTHLIFVSDNDKYMHEALSVHAAGYLLKPFKESEVKDAIDFIFPNEINSKRLFVQTFGGFDVFLDGHPVVFNRQRSKELLAILVDRRGSSITIRTACAILFEDKPYDMSLGSYFRVLFYDLRNTLREIGFEKILVKNKADLSIDPACFECDAYQFIAGDENARREYRGDYMPSYSWAEYSKGVFDYD